MIQNLGNHLIVELYDCDPDVINNSTRVENILKRAVGRSGATLVESVIHEFNPHGVSGVVVIEESHFSVHTWPEYGYCALDIFTCGKEIDSHGAAQFIKQELRSENMTITDIKRGVMDIPETVRHKPLAQKNHGNERNQKRL